MDASGRQLAPVSIIVPTFREAKNIPILVEQVFAALARAGRPGEMVIVDDNSKDGSKEAVAALAGRYDVRIVLRENERGLSSAVVRGFDEAKHDLMLCMDADLSHPPESVPEVIRPIESGEADFCIGSRYVAGGKTKEDWGLLRKINSVGATMLARPLTSAKDPMAGFFCISREVYERASKAGLNPIGYKIGLEIMIKGRCQRVREVPIVFADRVHGESKLNLKQQLLYLKHLWTLYRFRWPLMSIVAVFVAVFLGYFLVFLGFAPQ
jgi:dolichol-phosphate mannosyltransferase